MKRTLLRTFRTLFSIPPYSWLAFLALLIPMHSVSQNLPSDSLVLSKIFGNVDFGNKSYTYAYKGNETIYAYEDSVVFRVTQKAFVKIGAQELLFTLLQAPYGRQHGHQLGFSDIYYFKAEKGKIELFDSIKSGGTVPLGYNRGCEIVNIGKDKTGVIFTFESDGNGHIETSKSLLLLGLKDLTYLLSINTEYDNTISRWADSETDSCEAERYFESFEIVESHKEWYDIKVHRTEYRFTPGCKEQYLYSEFDKVYVYTAGKYEAK